MIVLRPDEVRFGSTVWEGVSRVTVDRLSSQTLDEWGELGNHLVFVDVARQRVVIRVSQEIESDDFEEPVPGELEELVFVGSSGGDAVRRKVRADVVVESVLNRVSDFGSTRVITMIAVSSDGVEDPISVNFG
jgi:hypothetical protein